MYAKEMKMTIKLLASSKRDGDHLHAIVAPALLGNEHPLYSVNGVFYGSGAGKLPTASAVVADVVDEAKHLHRNIMTMWKNEKLELLPIEDTEKRFFVRISGDEKMRREEPEAAFGAVTFVRAEGLENEFGIITEVMTEGAYRKIAEKFEGILHMIRVEE